MISKIKKLKYRLWDEYNPEGVRGKDVFFMLLFSIGGFLLLLNLCMWLRCPEQAWIGEMLFPFAKCVK